MKLSLIQYHKLKRELNISKDKEEFFRQGGKITICPPCTYSKDYNPSMVSRRRHENSNTRKST